MLWGQTAYLNTVADLDAAQRLGEQLLDLANQEADPARQLMAYRGLGPTYSHKAQLALAQQCMDHAVAIYDSEQHREFISVFGADPGIICLSFGMINLWVLGNADRALAWSQKAKALAQTLDHPYSQAFAQGFSAWLHVFRREANAAKQAAESALALSEQYEFAQIRALAEIFQGWAIAQLGEAPRGIQELHAALDHWRATGAEVARPHWLALLSEQYLRMGQFAAVEPLLTEALAAVKRTGERRGEAELYRLQGELVLRQNGAAADAEAHFQQALATARRQGALAWELRTTLSLARLWQKQGRQTDAYQLLHAVYNRFDEGFATPDLLDAAALLHELA